MVLTLIHIGKCGGSSLRTELYKKNIKFNCFHTQKVAYDKNANYVIIIRNPIQRFISAFNWRHKLVCKDKSNQNRFMNEYNLLNKYNNVDNLCNELKTNKNIFNQHTLSGNYIHHLREDIYYYLDDIIDKCLPSQIKCVILIETMNEDLKEYFDIDLSIHEKNNSQYSKIISDENYKILKDYLKRDYEIIDKMYQKGWIDEFKYNILKK